MNYDLIEKPLNEATLEVYRSHIKEYINYCELDGIWFKRSIIKLKNKPKDEHI